MERSLKICFAASEVSPLAKTGGLADVTAALAAQLAANGHDVRVFMPLYRRLREEGRPLEPVEGLEHSLGNCAGEGWNEHRGAARDGPTGRLRH